MRLRVALLAVAVAGVAVAPASSGARRWCPMVADQARDVTISVDPTIEREQPELDLRSVDAVSDQRTLTMVVRVTKLAPSPMNAPFGARWGVSFRVSGTTTGLGLAAITDMSGAVRYVARYTHPTAGVGMDLADITGSFDRERSEIRMTAPLDIFESVSPMPPGTWLEAISAYSGRNYGPYPGGYNPADRTRTGTHQINGVACVRK